jgi:hypothetical protein
MDTMKRIKEYKKQGNTFIVYFDGEINPLYCDKKEFAVLQIEDMIARHCISKGLLKILEDYKEAVRDLAYEDGYQLGYENGREY